VIKISNEFYCEKGDYIKGIGHYKSYKKFLVLNKRLVNTVSGSYYYVYDIKLIERDDGSGIGEIYKSLQLDKSHFEFFISKEDNYILEE